MLMMVHLTVFAVIFLNVIGHNCVYGVRIGRKKVEVIHKGRPLQDLVILDSRISPHDLDYMSAFVKPKLLEDSKAEGIMLQKNGIEDFRPLDLSIETEEDHSNDQAYEDGIDQTSINDNSDKNGDYDLKNMPEYNMETKADFKGNQEVIDWMMKDPNDFNVKSYEDSSLLEDTDNFSQSKDSAQMLEEHNDEIEHNGRPSLHHHINHGSKRHHGTSTVDTKVQLLNQDSDVKQSLLNEMAAKRHRHVKTARLKEKYNDGGDDNSEYSTLDNVRNGKKLWHNTGEDPHDAIFDENDIGQSPRETTLNNLNGRIKNQDARLFRELEGFQNIDNFENGDDSDVLGNFDEENDEGGDFGDTIKSTEHREDDSSSEKDAKLSSERKFDNLEDTDVGAESESENDSSGYEDDDHQDDDDDNGSEHLSKNYDNDRVNQNEDETQSGQKESENVNDTEDFKSKGRVYNEDSQGAANVEGEDETDDEGKEENAKVIEMGSEQTTSNLKTKYVNGKDTVKGEDIESKNKHQPANAHIQDGNKSNKKQEKKIANETKGPQASNSNEKKEPSNSKLVQDTTFYLKSKNEKHIFTESIPSTKDGNGKIFKDEASGNGKNFQGTTRASKSDHEKHMPMDNVTNGRKTTTTISNVADGKNFFNKNKAVQNSISDTYQAPVRQPGNNGKITADKPPLRAGINENDKQRVVHQKPEDNNLKMEGIPQTKPLVALTRLENTGRIKPQLHKEKEYNHNSDQNRPTTTGFRRNQPNYAPSTPTYSMSDLHKLQRIVSYLRGLAAPTSSPTKTSGYLTPDSLSLKSLYYYPLHPTPQEDTDAIQGTKDSTFSEWNDWSTCSVTCGKGTSVRARVCLVSTCSQKDLLQTKHCYENICTDDVERESLQEHNKLRRKHLSPPLLWSNSLARKAQNIAQNLAAKDFLTLDDLQEQHGESLAQIQYTNEHLAKKAIDKWYGEINSYSFSYPKISEKTRHFAQIVWKRTNKMGLAVAKSPSSDFAFVVALYSPPIDNKEHLRQNVLAPGVKNDLYSTIRRRRTSWSRF